MFENAKLLHKINSIFKPIAKFIIFLFTTKTGLFILFLLFLLWIYIRLYNRLKERKLQKEAATGEDKLSVQELSAIIFDEISGIFTFIFTNISVLLVSLLIMFTIVGISAAFSSVEDYLNKRQQINNLKITLKNLDQSYRVAKVEVIDRDLINDSTTLKVKFYDYAGNDYMPDEQVVKLPGHNIYFLMYLINFKYSLIESGEKVNITLPYLIYSEKQRQDEGIRLKLTDSIGVPYIFHRDSSDIYGISYSDYESSIKEIAELITDPEKARQAGVISQYVAAPHYTRILKKGQSFEIWVEQTRGLVIKQDEW